VSGRAAPSARPPRGRHFLRSRAFAEELVRSSEVEAGTLVLDLGAGGGILTRALADRGARVVAVELDPLAAAGLRRRFANDPRVEVREADAAALRLPQGRFSVVANLPFAAGTTILRSLLDDPNVPLTRLDAIVEWRLAAKRAAVWPSTLLGCAWGAWYELSIARRVPRICFAPPPSVDAAVLRAVRRREPLVPVEEARAYLGLLRRAFGARAPVERVVPRAVVRRVAHELGFDPRAHARDLDAREWAGLHAALRRPGTGRPVA
jgi:23S rRNA (adenine-N6)-dimethyltransferase